MQRIASLFLCLILFPSTLFAASNYYYSPMKVGFFQNIQEDYHRFYGNKQVMLSFAAIMGAGGLSANTHFDKSIYDHWQRQIRHHSRDHVFNFFQGFGENAQMHLPFFLAAMLWGHAGQPHTFRSQIGEWGERSFRTWLVGAPAQLVLTDVVGGERPTMGGSHWKPFHGYRGISGHAFFGSVPLITAAMMTDNPYYRYPLYALSMLPGFARMNNQHHYFSQILLGWSFAYLAARTVSQSSQEAPMPKEISVHPMIWGDGIQMAIEIPFF